MNIEQFAMLVFHCNDGSRKCGTGYFVTERRLITAAHGLDGDSQVCVRLGDRDVPVLPIWKPKETDDVDLALLEISDSTEGEFPKFSKPFFRNQSLMGNYPFHSYGYPKATIETGDDVTKRTRVSLTGEVDPPDPENRFLHLTAKGEALDPKQWGGISGAPIFVDGRIVGIISETLLGLRGRLTAQPIAPILSNAEYDDFRVLLGLGNKQEAVEKAISEMIRELEAHPHLHWAFSLAWAKEHDYVGLADGGLAPQKELAENLISKMSNFDACSLADLADLWLLEYESALDNYAFSRIEKLAKKEPLAKIHRFRTAEKLVDLVFCSSAFGGCCRQSCGGES